MNPSTTTDSTIAARQIKPRAFVVPVVRPVPPRPVGIAADGTW